MKPTIEEIMDMALGKGKEVTFYAFTTTSEEGKPAICLTNSLNADYSFDFIFVDDKFLKEASFVRKGCGDVDNMLFVTCLYVAFKRKDAITPRSDWKVWGTGPHHSTFISFTVTL